MEENLITRETYCQRLSRSCTGICAGIVIFVAALFLAGWNEYRSVATEKTISAAQKAYVDVFCRYIHCSPIDKANTNRLVHASCPLSNYATFSNVNGLTSLPPEKVTGIRLVRNVEVLQWVESSEEHDRKDANGGTIKETTYWYALQWSTSFVNSNSFAQPSKCASQYNQGRPCINVDPSTQKWWEAGPQQLGSLIIGRASTLHMGDFLMPPAFVDSMGQPTRLNPSCDGSTTVGAGEAEAGALTSSMHGAHSALMAPGQCPEYLQIHDNYMYYLNEIGRNVALDENFSGDVRASYTIFNTTDASVLAKQSGTGMFAPWAGPYDHSYTIFMVEDGSRSADDMLLDAEHQNMLMTWGLRALSYLAVFIGLQLTLAPLTVVADGVPFIGSMLANLTGAILCCFSCLITSFCWFTLVAVAWIALRPMIGIPLLILGVGSFFAAGWWKRYNDRKGTDRAIANAQNISVPFLGGGGFCPSCGASRGDGAFCGECGSKA